MLFRMVFLSHSELRQETLPVIMAQMVVVLLVENGHAAGTCDVTWTSSGTRPFEGTVAICPNGGFTDTRVTPNIQILTPPCTGNSL